MANGRARKGGEIGTNGEFYEGGTFLPSTEQPKRPASAKGVKTGRRQVAPYVWEAQPYEGATAIYTLFAGVFGRVVDGVMVVNCADQTLDYFKRTRAEVEKMAARWNAGERWM